LKSEISWPIVATIALMMAPQPRAEDAAPGSAIANERIIGHWESGSRAYEGMTLNVTSATVDIGPCRHISYVIIKDRVGAGPGTLLGGQSEVNWRDIAVELKPKTDKQSRCITDWHVRVLEFSIPASLVCHAEIAIFPTRADFDRQTGFGWGSFGNTKCLPTQ
jgi:hypothetical protein